MPLREIAARVGTPAYVYSAAAITGAYRKLDQALRRQPHTICYAVKANSNLSILRLLARLGSGFDIVSGGELYRLQRAGVGDEVASFFPAWANRARRFAKLCAPAFGLFNVESAAELEVLAREAARARQRARRRPFA